MVETVILLPGIMGSQLIKDGDLVWPGDPHELLLPYGKMKELLDPNLEVGDVIRSVSISEQYESLLEALAKCGFSQKSEKPTLRTCPYDWRKDNALAADLLAAKVKQVRTDHGGQVEINLVAHSMGGLVSRYFLESGKFFEANCPGFGNVKRLITIGTPHRGAPLALCAALGQIKRLFLNAKQVKELANKKDFPALYQLMPSEAEPFVWNIDPEARLDPVSVYAKEVAKMLELSRDNLDSAKAFHAKLDVEKRPKAVQYFCFVGTRQSTIGNVQGNFAQLAPSPRGVEIADGGDGTVPSWSRHSRACSSLRWAEITAACTRPLKCCRRWVPSLARPAYCRRNLLLTSSESVCGTKSSRQRRKCRWFCSCARQPRT